MAVNVKRIKAKYEGLKTKKYVWLDYFQLIGEFIHGRKMEFTDSGREGSFLNREQFDSTATRDNQIMASALVGALWQGARNTLKIVPSYGVTDNDANKKYYEFMLNVIASAMDAPRAGLSTTLDEFMLDETSFGTAGIAVFENEDIATQTNIPIRFSAWDVKTMHIAENKWGEVDTIYNETQMTISQAVEEFGVENLSKKSRELYAKDKGDLEKIRVLHVIEPRLNRNINKLGNKDMPIASINIELGGADKILRESGFESMPVKVVRFSKLLGEVYGRGSGGAALPDAIELNAIWEAVTIALEKLLDPPMGVLSDGDLTPVIDTSAGAMTVFNVTGRMGNQPPVFPLHTVGEPRAVEPLIVKLTESLSNHFFLDRLLDLNNDTRMTFGEAQIRNELRAASLGSIFSRQIGEGLVPVTERTVEILFKQGRLGVMPDSEEAFSGDKEVMVIPEEIAEKIRNGLEFYNIKFISPAARAMNAEQVQGLLASLQFTTQAAQLDEDARDVIDVDKAIKKIAELTGAPEEIVKTLPAIEALRKARNTAAAQNAELESERVKSEIARNYAQAKAVAEGTGGGGGALNETKLGS